MQEIEQRMELLPRSPRADATHINLLVMFLCQSGEIGRRSGFKIRRANPPCRFESGLWYHLEFPPSRPYPPLCFVMQPRYDAALLFFVRSEEHTSELQSRGHLVCRLLLEKKKLIHLTYPCS